MLKKLKMYSQSEGKVAPFDVTLEDNVNGGKIIVVRHGDENYRFDSNITDNELRLHSENNVRAFTASTKGDQTG